MTKDPFAANLATLLGVTRRTKDFNSIVEKLTIKELKYLIFWIEERQNNILDNPYLEFIEAFKAFRDDAKRITCTYGAVMTRYNPESGIAAKFDENKIALGKWGVEK